MYLTASTDVKISTFVLRNIGEEDVKLWITNWTFKHLILQHFFLPKREFDLSFINPLGTTGLLTPFLIGSYHEMFTSSANYDKSLKILHHKHAHKTIFSYTLSNWLNKY